MALKHITPPFSHNISISVIHREGLWVSASCGDNVCAVLCCGNSRSLKRGSGTVRPGGAESQGGMFICPAPSSFTVNHFLHTVNEASSCALQCPAQRWHWGRKRRDRLERLAKNEGLFEWNHNPSNAFQYSKRGSDHCEQIHSNSVRQWWQTAFWCGTELDTLCGTSRNCRNRVTGKPACSRLLCIDYTMWFEWKWHFVASKIQSPCQCYKSFQPWVTLITWAQTQFLYSIPCLCFSLLLTVWLSCRCTPPWL